MTRVNNIMYVFNDHNTKVSSVQKRIQRQPGCIAMTVSLHAITTRIQMPKSCTLAKRILFFFLRPKMGVRTLASQKCSINASQCAMPIPFPVSVYMLPLLLSLSSSCLILPSPPLFKKAAISPSNSATPGSLVSPPTRRLLTLGPSSSSSCSISSSSSS